MNTIDLKTEVRRAIDRNWPAFQRDHPHLAGVIDESLVVASATQSLAEDPAYQEALRDAHLAGVAMEVGAELVERFVVRWLRGLF